jgi:hypothetical protein
VSQSQTKEIASRHGTALEAIKNGWRKKTTRFDVDAGMPFGTVVGKDHNGARFGSIG